MSSAGPGARPAPGLRGRALALAWPLAWMALIHVQSSLVVGAGSVALPLHADKVFHLLEYALLGVLLTAGLRHGLSLRDWPVVIALSFLLGSLYGLSDEFHQSFVAGRTASLGDALADAAGTALGTLVGSWRMRRSEAADALAA